MVTVEKAVMDKRREDPLAHLAYHKITETLTGLSIERKFDIWMCPYLAEEGGDKGKEKVVQMSLGALIPAKTWNAAAHTMIAWMVKWSVLGLTPVRPLVILKDTVNIPAGRAFQLL